MTPDRLARLPEPVTPDIHFVDPFNDTDGHRAATAYPSEAWKIEGMSEFRFAPEGKVASHIDYWDSGRQIREKLPLIGAAAY